MTAGEDGSSLDVHIGHVAPQRWDELEAAARSRPRFTGPVQRPVITNEPIDWAGLSLVPRWVGQDSSCAVAAIEPSLYAGKGADEWQRFVAGTRNRDECALVISMLDATTHQPLFGGPEASVSVPGDSDGLAYVGGSRIALARPPHLAPGLGAADRDLALRIKAFAEPAVRWWALSLTGATLERVDGIVTYSPEGALHPMLTSPAGEVVAAVWIAPDESMRHYFLPWLSTWAPVLDWLARQAIAEFVPTAARRIHAHLGEEPALQTTAEHSARAALACFDAESQTRRAELVAARDAAAGAADAVRPALLFGTGATLVVAVARVLRDAGCVVTDIDQLLGATVNADLLVEHRGRRWLVEVKSASGNAGEKLVEAPRKHLATWVQLRPQDPVEGITLVVNHQTRIHPVQRSRDVYTRAEFINTLTDIRVQSCVVLYDLWRTSNFAAIREAVFGGSEVGADPRRARGDADATAPARAQRRWWRRRRAV